MLLLLHLLRGLSDRKELLHAGNLLLAAARRWWWHGYDTRGASETHGSSLGCLRRRSIKKHVGVPRKTWAVSSTQRQVIVLSELRHPGSLLAPSGPLGGVVHEVLMQRQRQRAIGGALHGYGFRVRTLLLLSHRLLL